MGNDINPSVDVEKKPLSERFKNWFIGTKSREYQRMLVGIRVYYSLLGQRKSINSIIVLLFTSAIFFIFFGILAYNRQESFFSVFSFPLIFLIILLVLSFFTVYWENDFNIIKGFNIIRKNPLVLLFQFFILFIVIYVIIGGMNNLQFSIEFFLILIGYLFFTPGFTILLQIQNELQLSSIISYSIEKLNDTTFKNKKLNTKEKSKKFLQFYYSIYVYYKLLSRNISDKYRDDTLIFLQVDKIPILATQIITNDEKKKKKLMEILSKIEVNDVFDKPDEFIEAMEMTSKNFSHSLNLSDNIIDNLNLFKEKTLIEKIKYYLIPIIPIIAIAINVYLNII